MDLIHGFDSYTFRALLLNWWANNKRKYPWRETRDPYRLLIVEVLLHRTRADQVAPIYLELLQKFPSPKELAEASLKELGELLEPLGLFWRIKLLHDMANELVSRLGSKIPKDRNELESLPGVGHYIAAAVRCFAYGYPEALLDTNTVRICGRVFGIPVTDGSRRSKRFRELLEALVDPQHPREFNFALIDHGALICRSRTPLCSKCYIKQICAYGRGIGGTAFTEKGL